MLKGGEMIVSANKVNAISKAAITGKLDSMKSQRRGKMARCEEENSKIGTGRKDKEMAPYFNNTQTLPIDQEYYDLNKNPETTGIQLCSTLS